jgi:hypothetical protein
MPGLARTHDVTSNFINNGNVWPSYNVNLIYPLIYRFLLIQKFMNMQDLKQHLKKMEINTLMIIVSELKFSNEIIFMPLIWKHLEISLDTIIGKLMI